jgi:uncharacterized protein (DUF2236 family)
MLAEAFGLSLTRRLAESGQPGIDFRAPMGEAALTPADSVSWRVFKNPVALFVGGIAAVLLELAEPRVRSGVWEHSSFRDDPVRRMARTGLAAMVTVYGAKSVAERMIAGVRRMHGRVAGTTPDGAGYEANNPELLDWVQATASFGFLEAYAAFVKPLAQAQRDRYYAEGEAAASLYGATGAPRSEADCRALFAHMTPKLERSDIVFEFLAIVGRAPVLPPLLRPAQGMFIRAGVEILPADIRALLGLEQRGLAAWERLIVKSAGAAADRLPLPGPPADACARLGLKADYLYR